MFGHDTLKIITRVEILMESQLDMIDFENVPLLKN